MRNFNILKLIGDMTKTNSNLPERYIKRASEQVYWKSRGIQYLNRTVQRRQFRFTMNRPWTYEFKKQNMPGKYRVPVVVEPIKEWSYFIGDRVEVLIGKDKGKQGIVKQIIQERNWVIVEGLNTHLRTIGKTKDYPGVMVQSEAPLLVTNEVALVDPSDLASTKIVWQYTEEGERVRVSTRTGRIIPIPVSCESTIDYKYKIQYKESDKDTMKEDVIKITFQPQLKTFEMDIMDKMGIKENRTQKKTFWY